MLIKAFESAPAAETKLPTQTPEWNKQHEEGSARRFVALTVAISLAVLLLLGIGIYYFLYFVVSV